jgi:hypothetical protein
MKTELELFKNPIGDYEELFQPSHWTHDGRKAAARGKSAAGIAAGNQE